MAYIGRSTDKISNIEILDNITFDGSSSYSITKSSVAFVPNSAQSLLISIDGVVQATNFTVSSSTIDFGVAIPSTSTCDFFLHYGTGLITTPADGTVTSAKIGSGAVTTAKIADANVTSAKMFSGFKNGITEADQWRITADHYGVADITANWERNDTQFSLIGTGMTESSGIFTFPSTGIYLVMGSATGSVGGGASQFVNLALYHTINNSTYSTLSMAYSHSYTADSYFSMQTKAILDVTDTSNVKVKLGIIQNQANTVFVSGSTAQNRTYITFLRLGDT